MNEQVENMIPHMKVGSHYLFDHVRKGLFVASFQELRPAKEGDPQDTSFILVEILTEDGSGQERLANTFTRDEHGRKVRPKYEQRLIRPSLLRSISSPSTKRQQELVNTMATLPEEASLSLPTQAAMMKIEEPEDQESETVKRGFWSRMFGGGN